MTVIDLTLIAAPRGFVEISCCQNLFQSAMEVSLDLFVFRN